MTPEPFALESPTPGHVPPGVIEELRKCHREAKDYVAAFGDAVKAQSEKFGVKPGALRRYIAALEMDKQEDAEAEASDLLRLLDGEPE